MTGSYDDVVTDLRLAYDRGAAARDAMVKEDWKRAERQAFLDRVRARDGVRLLEIGAGPGHDSRFFADNGLTVTAVDLSPQMVRLCQAKGVDAHVADVKHLGIGGAAVDAVYTFNCLLHVPNTDLPDVLAEIRRVLTPGGLFYLGVYGGDSFEGTLDHDEHVPRRFFSRRTDTQLQDLTRAHFDVVDFHTVAVGAFHFQSLTLTPRP